MLNKNNMCFIYSFLSKDKLQTKQSSFFSHFIAHQIKKAIFDRNCTCTSDSITHSIVYSYINALQFSPLSTIRCHTDLS